MNDTARERIDHAAADHVQSHEKGDLVIGWVTLIATTNVDEDGCTVSGISVISSDETQPWTTHLGIIEAARIRAHHHFGTGDLS